MGVDDVALDHFVVIVFPEGRVHRSRVDFLGCLQQQTVFIKGHFDNSDVVGLCKACHEVPQRRVEASTSARRDHVGGKGPRNDLFDQDAAGIGDLEGIERVLLQMSRNGVGHLVGQSIHVSKKHPRVVLATKGHDAVANQVEEGLRQFSAAASRLTGPRRNGRAVTRDAGDVDACALDVGHPVG